MSSKPVSTDDIRSAAEMVRKRGYDLLADWLEHGAEEIDGDDD